MLTIKRHSGTSREKIEQAKVLPLRVAAFRIKPGMDFAAQAATHFAAVEFAKGGGAVIPAETLAARVEGLMCALCMLGIADGTLIAGDAVADGLGANSPAGNRPAARRARVSGGRL